MSGAMTGYRLARRQKNGEGANSPSPTQHGPGSRREHRLGHRAERRRGLLRSLPLLEGRQVRLRVDVPAVLRDLRDVGPGAERGPLPDTTIIHTPSLASAAANACSSSRCIRRLIAFS
jgi:hypothetical protein